ncbi:MAG: hypothetical protein U1E60_11615 [Reyranellaceae bacterium]
MRYTVQQATAVDVAHIANKMSENGGTSAPAAVNHLLRSCAFSRQLWAARDSDGTPAALWGVVPSPEQPRIGRLWMMLVETDEQDRQDLADSSRLVVDEMLTEFGELENLVPADSAEAIEVLCRMGFHVGPALPLQTDAPLQRRAWLDAGEVEFATSRQLLH